ncbi:MAG: glycosyltransferase family 4 protein [Candidatus Omnitrophica bacterium]|nr:glycosyltransferase family 4 protein [Candidatus Omnitrophota bacterium]
MNILFLTTHLNTGGITSYLLTLGEDLVKAGHQVFIVSSGGDCEEGFLQAGMHHTTIDIRTKSEASLKLWLNAGKIQNLIRKENIHIIHAQTRVTQVLGAFLSQITGVKMVTTCHGFFKPRWFRKTFPCWGQGVIAISKPVYNHLRGDFGILPDQIHLIANGIDLSRFSMTKPDQKRQLRQKWQMDDAPLIGIIARLSDVKGIDVLLKGMPLILKVIPKAMLIIAGEGPDEEYLQRITRDLLLEDHVRFMPTINKTHELLGAFDVFAMPSIMEGLGLSVIEAQACGIPVVASKVGGLIDLIEDGINGYLVPVNDPEALAGRIIDVLNTPQKAQLMAEAARDGVEQNFSAQRMTKETIKVYEKYSRC